MLAGDIVIKTPEQFARYADRICAGIDSLYLAEKDVLEEPDCIQSATAIPETMKTHKIVRGVNKRNVQFNQFFYLSTDKKPHFTQWYGNVTECGHNDEDVDDNTCAQCKSRDGQEWMQCSICQKWFHATCFYE